MKDGGIGILSAVEIAKETLNAVKKLSKEKYAVNIVSKGIRMFAAILLICIWLNDKLNLGIPFSKIILNLWEEKFRNFIKNNVYIVGVFWVVYKQIISNILRKWCVCFDETEEVKSLPILFTLNDFIDFVSSLFFGVYAINLLAEYNNSISNGEMNMGIVAGGYLTIEFVKYLYIKNCNNWYRIHREYTHYFDVNNRSIPKGATVIYHGKLYRVKQQCYTGGINSGCQKSEWRLDSYGENNSLSLEEAAKDKDGKLTIVKWEDWHGENE